MEKNLVMESHGKWVKQIKSWKFKKVMEKSWNFSTAYRESRMINSDNSVSIRYCSVLATCGRLSVYVLSSKS